MSTVVCWFKRTLKQLEREQTDTQTDRHTHTQDDYSNPRACAPRVNNKTDSGDRLLAILSVRVKKSKPLTWNDIDSALRSDCVDESRLSDKIREKYGHFFYC